MCIRDRLFIVVAIVTIGRFVFAAYVWPELDRRRATKSAATQVISYAEPSFIKRNLVRFGIAALFLFPVFVIWTSGVQGSLKWIDNFGIQVLIYVCLLYTSRCV